MNNETIEIIDLKDISLLTLGKKYYPKLQIRNTYLKNWKTREDRFFTNWPKNRGSHSYHGFKLLILQHLMKDYISSISGKIH